MQIDFKNLTKSRNKVINTLGIFWQKIYKFILLILLLVAVFLGGFIWKNNVSSGQWDTQKKQEYLNSQNSSIIFNEDDFKKATDDFKIRGQERNYDSKQLRDVFKAY